jgi:ATP-dependent RNA helicase DeaD
MITFEELGVAPQYIRAIQELGFETPMPVQEKVIPLLLGEKTDIVVLAQTGTGKTAAYGLPLVQLANTSMREPQVLILCPTRELCMQITGDINDFAKYNDELKALPVYGGSSIDLQIKALKKGVQIVVATPGRLLDLIRRKAIKLNLIHTVILDEADEMLNMGFSESLNDILAEIPENRNTLLFSATMPNEVATIAKKYMKDPVEVTIGNRNAGAENIKHLYFTVHARDKYLALKRIVDFYPSIYGIVFCRTRKETQEVADKLIHDGYNAESLHGELSQAQRDMVMNKFRIRHIRLLVATDVAARGLDVEDLTHIINYNLPEDLDSYTHRSGRTGRAGKAGTSIILINLKEKHLIRQIEKKINKSFTAAMVPTGRQICEKQLFNLIDKMEKVDIEDKEIDTYLPQIYRKLEWLDQKEIIKRFVALEFNRFLEYYKNAPELNVPDEKQYNTGRTGESKKRFRMDESDFGYKGKSESQRWSKKEYGGKEDRGSRRQAEPGYTRLFINLGKSNGLYPGDLIELINRNTKGKMIKVGKIDIMKKSTIFEVISQSAGELVSLMKDKNFKDSAVTVDFVKEQNDTGRSVKNDFERRDKKDSPWRNKMDFKRSGNKKSEHRGKKDFKGAGLKKKKDRLKG